MKKRLFPGKYILATGLLWVFIIFLLHPVNAQENDNKESKKTVHLKILSKEDGNTKVIDTTFDLTSGIDHEELQAMLKELKTMKGMKFGYDDIDFRFDIPCLPDMDVEKFSDFNGGNFYSMPEMRMPQRGHGDLSDILGRIPMERVKSYSVKDRKGGKRIIIDVEDAPFFLQEDRVVVIKQPRSFGHLGKGNKKKKIIYEQGQPEPPLPPAIPEKPLPPSNEKQDTPEI